MSIIPIFWADPLTSLADLITDLSDAFVIGFFYEHHSYVLTTIDVYEAAHIASFIRHKLPENKLPIELFIFLEDLAACFNYIVGNGRPVFFGKSLYEL